MYLTKIGVNNDSNINIMSLKSLSLIILSLIFLSQPIFSQDKTSKYFNPIKIDLNEEGDSYFRLLIWQQFWLQSGNLADNGGMKFTSSIRRSRMLGFAELSPRVLVLTHFGLNSLNENTLSSLGNNGDGAQFFLHGAWAQFMISNEFTIGGGLHYWNGMTRMANFSTISFMTMDQSRPFVGWHSLGITDQFARHLGVFAKGRYGHIEYRFAWNTPGSSPLGAGKDYSVAWNEDGIPSSSLEYTGASQKDPQGISVGKNILTGYIKYNLLDNESIKLPYYSGTYLGKKEVIAIGGGFFLHPNGMFNTETREHSDIKHFALDFFMDLPVNNGSINTYIAFQKFDYGPNYISRWAGTGNSIYGQFGYYLDGLKVMPYAAYSYSDFEAAQDPIQSLNIGLNYFIHEHNCKLTAEYHLISKDYRESSMTFDAQDIFTQFRLQFQVFI
ncbi:MAG: hypothetical protein HKO89_03335 [Saprospiraceae bacterium]|nr:hypothetical protein [Saprospiraceae bacterium]